MAMTPLLIGLAVSSAASSVASAGIQAHAAGKAVKAQQAATNQGLAATRSNANQAINTLGSIYNANKGNFTPYQSVGADAMSTLGNLTGTSRPTAPAMNQGTTLMTAPDGSQRPVPNDKVAFFQSKGAKVSQNAPAPVGA